MLRWTHLDDQVPQVLLWGTSGDLQALSATLGSLAKAEALVGGPKNAEALSRLILIPEERAAGMRLIGNELRWEIAADDRSRFSELVRALAASSTPGHCYLDSSTGQGIEVKISLDEYPADWRP